MEDTLQTTNSDTPTIPEQTKQIIRNFLLTEGFDFMWKKSFRWTTFFEGLPNCTTDTANNGWGAVFGGTGSVANGSTGLLLTTGANSTDFVRVKKWPTYQKIINFQNVSFMRTSIGIVSGSTTSVTTYVVHGGLGTKYYGFKVVGTSLYGVTYDGTTENAVLLKTVAADTVYSLEARYYPANKVVFLIDGEQVGVSIANLPAATSAVVIELVDIRITTNTTAAREVWFSFFEYAQLLSTIN